MDPHLLVEPNGASNDARASEGKQHQTQNDRKLFVLIRHLLGRYSLPLPSRATRVAVLVEVEIVEIRGLLQLVCESIDVINQILDVLIVSLSL